MQRTKNAARNVLFDGLLRGINIVIPFLMRSIMLHYMGVEYLGLNGLFRSVLIVLNLAELGVGSAMVFSMYKPIAEKNKDEICALMNLYRSFYRIIGLIIAVIGIALTPLVKHLINGDVTADINLYILYFMNLGSTVISYWMFAYKASLLYAHQRLDVSSKITIICHCVEYVLKALVLITLHNYYLYLAIQLLSQVASNIIIAWKASKMYPEYKPVGTVAKEKMRDIIQRIKDLFTAKLSYVISNAVDTMVISAYLGLTSLAIYQNYYYILMAARTMFDVITRSCMAGIGESMVTESAEKNYHSLRKISLLSSWLIGVCSALMLCLYQPFMELWMGKNNMLGLSYVVCFVIYYYFVCVNKMVNMFKDAAGLWHKDRFRPLTAAIVNLVLNLSTVKTFGLYGILLSTVISIVAVEIPWLLYNLFTEVFPKKYMYDYIKNFVGFIITACFACFASYSICDHIHASTMIQLTISAMISFTVSNLIFFLVYRKNIYFQASMKQFSNMAKSILCTRSSL